MSMMYPTFNSTPNYIGIGQGAAASRLRRRREEEGKSSPVMPLYEGMMGIGMGVDQLTEEELLEIEQGKTGNVLPDVGPVFGVVLGLAAFVFVVGLFPSR